VKNHVCSLNYTEWSLAELIQELYQINEILNTELFDGVLTTPVITVSSIRVTALGCFIIGRNEFGAKNHIQLNAKHLKRPKIQIYKTLLHEMLHQSEYEIHCKHKKFRGNYHSSLFRSMASELGIPCDEKGCTIGIVNNSPFTRVLMKHNLVDGEELDKGTALEISDKDEIKLAADSHQRSKLLKYSCACTNVRVAVLDFRARCLKCGQEFELSDKFAIEKRNI